MGLPGAGKSYLSKILSSLLNARWLNADQVRKDANDWDFSVEGRKRQAKRMKDLSKKYLKKQHVIADFVCPTKKTRNEYNPDFLVFMDTIKKGRYGDTNRLFEKPKKYNFRVPFKNAELYAIQIADKIKLILGTTKNLQHRCWVDGNPGMMDIKRYLKKLSRKQDKLILYWDVKELVIILLILGLLKKILLDH